MLFLALFALISHQLQNNFCQFQDLFISLGVLSTLHQDPLFGGERNLAIVGFGVKVETIKERTLIKVLVRINLKQVHFPHFGIASRVVATQAGITSLDQAVNPNIFNDVQTSHCDGERNASVLRQLGDGRQQVIVNGMQSVGHFVTQEHIGKLFGHLLPDGHRQHTRLNVKHRRGCGRINVNANVLGGKEFGKTRGNGRKGITHA